MRIFKIYSLSKFHYYFNNVQYNIINYSHHVLHYTSYLFYNWNFVSFDTLHPFHSPSTPQLWQPPYLFSVSWLHFFFFKESTYKWDNKALVFVFLINFI